jgi:hypothetical protein
MSDASRPASSLCYPGKRIELHQDATFEVTTVTQVDGNRVGVCERACSFGPCEAMVVFFGERFVASAYLIPAVRGAEVVIETGFVPINARSAPRVEVSLAGTYYLHPPSVGIPMEIRDLSVSGVAISVIPDQHPSPGQRRMISFRLVDRDIKAVIELVAVEADLWRARFCKLALSDEDAIARLVMSSQLERRHKLSDLEIRTSSSLDLETRLEFPLIESISWKDDACTLEVGSLSATVMVPAAAHAERHRIDSLIGVARVGDPRDFAHLLGLTTSDVIVRDSVLTPYLVLCARHRNMSVAEVLMSWVKGIQEPLTQTMAGQPETRSVVERSQHDRSVAMVPSQPSSGPVGYSCGVAVFRELVPELPTESFGAMDSGLWMDPIALVLLIRELGFAVMRPIWPTLTSNSDGAEVFEAFATFGAGALS